MDRQRAAARTVRANLDALGVGSGRARVVDQDVFRFLARVADHWDLALADPPYEGDAAARLVETYRTSPFASQLWVEHRAGAPGFEAAHRTRRYGDTALSTFLEAET